MSKIQTSVSVEIEMLIKLFERYARDRAKFKSSAIENDKISFNVIFKRLEKYGESSERNIAKDCLEGLALIFPST